ncbi:MAG: alpha/beta hydrolase fold domain-containing protein [Synergistaceae bacterium]|nr:alpha/beta hydrolase fold domain-containing protein [Synergistaceae bacterium]
MRLRHFFGITALAVLFMGAGCNMDYRSKDDGGGSSSGDDSYTRLASIQYLKSSDIDVRAELTTDRDGDNVLAVSHEEKEYMYYRFNKRGSGDEDSDSDGSNAAILANDSAVLTLRDSLVLSSGDHAHGVLSLGEGTSVVVSECVILTAGGNSSGVMTYGGGTATLVHITAETSGASSPAVHVTKKGGYIMAERGRFATSGTDSPAVLSEGVISISDAKIEASRSQAVVVDGKSSVALVNCNVSSNSESAVMLYRQSAGNPVTNTGAFSATDGEITCAGGDLFYVTNAAATIELNGTEITALDGGAFLRAEASEFGTAGSNGGQVDLKLTNQQANGDIYADGVSDLNLYLAEESYFEGTVNKDGTSARIFVSVFNSKWKLTGDSHIDSLSCEENSITLNGYTLYVDGKAYTAGTESTGTAIDFASDRMIKTVSEDTGGDDNTGGDSTGDDSTGGDNSGDNDTTTPEIELIRLSFDALVYTTGTVNGVAYRAYNDIVYVSSPVISDCQKLSIYIPEPYYSSRPVNGYQAWTAPIFIPNNSAGYMAASIVSPSDTNPVGLALSNGLVVVSPALRGRNTAGGSAPAAVVDYKAAIRYIRANKNRLPAGNTDRIIVSGVSSGGALAAIVGASGNSPDYDTWLEELGAAETEDNIFAAVSYCPVTNLENADGAYEWVFGGEKYGSISLELASDFASYVTSLGLVKDSRDIIADDGTEEEYEENTTFRRYIEGLLVQAAQEALDAGTVISADWVTVSGDKALSADIRKYADSFAVRQKSVPAFDKLDLSSPENSEFGYKHFTQYSYEHSTSGGAKATDDIIWAMNPMEYIENADNAQCWRIRQGINDRDIPLTIPAVLALRLENAGLSSDFGVVWGQGHGGYYDTEDLFSWIDSVCK